MDRSSSNRVRRALAFGALSSVLALAPAGCFFPEFTFNDDTGGGGTGATSTGGGGSGGTTTSTSATGATGGGGTGGTGGMTTSMMTGGGGVGGTGGMPTGGGGTGGSTMTTTTTDTMTTSTTTTETMPPLENCVNGVDDDGDTNIDCKDTECADHSCVSSIPNGWTGPFLLYEGTAASDPGCTEDFPMEAYLGFFNLNAPPPTCAACSCGSPQGEVCTPPSQINIFDAPCGGTPTTQRPLLMPVGWTGTCSSAIDPMTGMGYYWGGSSTCEMGETPPCNSDCGPNNNEACNVSITAAAPTVQGGFCSATGGQATVVPAKWDGFARACGGAVLTGKGCAINQTCLPKPEAPYVGGLCIKKSGNVNCPAGMFNTKHLFFDDFTDSRTCTGCQCGAPAGSTCAGDIATHSDSIVNQCLAPVVTFQAGACANLAGNPAAGNSKFTVTTPPTGGSCAASGGAPSGVAVGTFPQTFCCVGN